MFLRRDEERRSERAALPLTWRMGRAGGARRMKIVEGDGVI